eukprot:jgi/Psemu1/2167/gm1.2167_g
MTNDVPATVPYFLMSQSNSDKPRPWAKELSNNPLPTPPPFQLPQRNALSDNDNNDGDDNNVSLCNSAQRGDGVHSFYADSKTLL